MNKLTTGFVLVSLALVAASCGDGNGSNPDAPRPIDARPPDAGPPAPPTLGAQMDRMGRPAINTALNHTFDANNTTKQAAKDAYNSNTDKSTWASDFAGDFRAGLAILDGLEGGNPPNYGCGNQLGADLASPRYSALAGLLSDDELYVNSASGTCSAYLAVEANALNILPNSDCGGRVMNYDVIKTSYSTLVIGALSGLDDGITSEAVPSDPTTFPFLAAPL